MRELRVLGIDFRTASVAVRESLAFDAAQTAALLDEARREGVVEEAMVLSTCNRIEFYLASAEPEKAVSRWLELLRRVRPSARIIRSGIRRFILKDEEGAEHLFRVACGLESALLGDRQITAQIKNACRTAGENGMLGPTLSHVYTQAMACSLEARTRTGIGRGAVSVGSVLCEMIKDHIEASRLGTAAEIVVVGAGEAAKDIAAQVFKRKLGRITIISRNGFKARILADQFGAVGLGLEDLEESLMGADVVVTASAVAKPLIDKDMQRRVAAIRSGLPLLIDAGVPRNVEPGGILKTVNIDGIRERQGLALAARRDAVPGVERLVAKESSRWSAWRESMPLEEVLASLYKDLPEMGRLAAKSVARDGAGDGSEIERSIVNSFKKLLHTHVRKLRSLPCALPR